MSFRLSLCLHAIVVLFLFSSAKIFSQQFDSTYAPVDSLFKRLSDTTKNNLSDTLKKTTIDTTKKTGEIDDIIKYTARDSAVFDIKEKKLMLYNEGDLKYKEYDMKAARITFFKDNSTLESHGIPDTVNPKKYIGTPVFLEGAKKYEANIIKYNFNTRKGNISMGSTEMEGGYYTGEKIKKVGGDIFFVENGRYTTCDKADPDFYFGSPKMKVIQGDKVIAEPVYLFIDDVPVFAIPFGIFPNHSGRSSGIIPPAYGEDATYGRYLSHLGYFWAINDYTDLELEGNYFTKGRQDLSGRFRYVKRYLYNGEVDLGGSRIRLGETGDLDKTFSDEWRIGVTHTQTIDPSTSLNANVNILSSKSYFNNSSNNLNDLLLQNAISDITLQRTWEGTPSSMSINYHRDQNLHTGEINERIPSVSFVHSQTYPFRSKNTSQLDLKWFELISYDYNAQLLDNHTKTLNPPGASSLFIVNARAGLRQALNISAPIKFSEFSLSPQISYTETWYNKYITKNYNQQDSTVHINEFSGFKTMRYFSTGVSLNTRIIGIFNTDFLSIKGFRHTIQPAISYSYQPDFSKPFWNYYTTYTDKSGNPQKYSFFEQDVFGAPPSGESQSINLSLNNIFEMKTRGKKDTVDNKFQLLNLSAGVSYNFAADSLRLSELGLTYRTDVAKILSIGGGASFNFYKYVDSVGRINKFLWTTDRRLANLTAFNISLSTSFQSSQEPANSKADSLKRAKEQYNFEGVYGDKAEDFSIPWAVTFGYNYSENKPSPNVIIKNANLSGSFNFSLTPNWKFTFSTGYDMVSKQLTAPYITVYRDLHCWEMSLNWIPVGVYRGYRFELKIKAPQLQDVKLTKQTNYRGVY
jgi:lipopolysaccharide assembly outer membrane protein LptD (OstA)